MDGRSQSVASMSTTRLAWLKFANEPRPPRVGGAVLSRSADLQSAFGYSQISRAKRCLTPYLHYVLLPRSMRAVTEGRPRDGG
jgi:hypothetical protein